MNRKRTVVLEWFCPFCNKDAILVPLSFCDAEMSAEFRRAFLIAYAKIANDYYCQLVVYSHNFELPGFAFQSSRLALVSHTFLFFHRHGSIFDNA